MAAPKKAYFPGGDERKMAQKVEKARANRTSPDTAKAYNEKKLAQKAKAKKPTVVESGNKSGLQAKAVAKAMDKKKAPAKGGSNPAEKLIQNITNRYRVTAREARDIVTAVGTAAKAPKFAGNVVKQVKEAATAAATGKKGESAYVISKNGKNATKTSRKKFEEGTTTSVSTKGKLM